MKENAKKGEQTRERILAFIIRYFEQHGYAPSFKEICEDVGLYSKSSVYNHIHKMLEIGMLETDAENGSPRAIRVPGYKFVKEDFK